MNDEVARLLPARKGHFLLESGHHGDMWLDLELLCFRPAPVRLLAAQLAARLAAHRVEAVCGPLVEGAFVALMVASDLDLPFAYAERFATGKEPGALHPFEYRIPAALRRELRGRRVAIVDDVINAGSAVGGTFAALKSCDAEPVAIGAIAVLGASAAGFVAEKKLALEAIAFLPNEIWTASACPLCARGVALTDPSASTGNPTPTA